MILAIDQEVDPQPWVIAALIDKRLYLFDPQLGLPIPRSDGIGIATLDDVLSDPTILKQLSDHDNAYPIDEEDLKRIVALIDAPFPYLTQKMWILERSLPAKYKLILSTTPSSLAQELRQVAGITNVGIWPLPYDAVEYRMANYRNLEFMTRLDATSRPFSGDNALANGRRQHIRGAFSGEPPEKGAKQYYLDCRLPDEKLADLKLTEEVLHVLGIEGVLPDDRDFLRVFIPAQTERLRFFKRHASYFLGLIAFDEGNYKVAIDYLQKRTLEADPQGEFADGANYALARCYEQLGILQNDPQLIRKAIATLAADQSAQAQGNHLRAKRLQSIYDGASATINRVRVR